MATAAQIQAEIAAGPQTQAALDAALLKYSPAEMAAAFPQFGNVADFANARQDAAKRSAPTTEFVTGGGNPMSDAERQRLIAVETAKREAAAAKLAAYTPADPTLAPYFANPASIPRLSGETVEEAVERLKQVDMDRTQRQAARDAIRRDLGPNDFLIAETLGTGGNARTTTGSTGTATGTGTTTSTGTTSTGGGLLDTVGTPTTTPATPAAPASPATPAAPVNPRIAAIQQWYNSNVGRTDPQAQGDLNRFLATSGFTAREINAALPQWGLNDLQNAMRTAIGEVAQQTPFAPVAAQPMQPLAQPYTSIASQLPGGADTRMQEIRNWYAANEGRGTQADLDRWLASGYTAQEINRALPQWGVADLDRAIANARQQFPQAEVQSGLARYQTAAPGAQFTGAVSPYGLIMDQMQPFTNPYADTLANVALGGYDVPLNKKKNLFTRAVSDVFEGGVEGGGPGDDGSAPGDTGGTPGASGSTDADGGTSAGGCVDPNVMVLLATGASIRAGDIKVGDMLHTLHEDTLAYGDYPVEFVSIITQPKVEITFHDGQKIIVSTTHKFLTDKNEWLEVQQMEIGQPIKTQHGSKTLMSVNAVGDGPVVKMTVTDAHTYIADGLVSHNKYNGGLVTEIFGTDPAGPDEGQINIQRGEYVIKKSSVNKYGKGLLDMINDGKIPAKKIKSLLD